MKNEKKLEVKLMTMATTTTVSLRSSQNDPIISKSKGVYSIDQILGTQNRQNNNNIGKNEHWFSLNRRVFSIGDKNESAFDNLLN